MKNQLTPQQELALDYKKNISLAANAGSGKTFVLSKRFVQIFVNEDVDLNSIVAITFTDKAAGELNKKISNEVEIQLLIESDYKKRNRLEKLRRELVSANIATIHSFCISLLKEHAPAAGIDANFFPIDQELSNELVDLAIEETLNNKLKDETTSGNIKYLVRIFGSNSGLKTILQKAIQKRRTIEILERGIYSLDENEIALFFVKQFESNFITLFEESTRSLIEAIKRINSIAASTNPKNKYSQSISRLLEEYGFESSPKKKMHFINLIKQEILTSEGLIRNRGYLSKDREFLANEIECCEKIFEELKYYDECDLSGRSEIELARFGKAFIEIFKSIVMSYSEKKKQRSYLDFEDILLFTNKIIADEAVTKQLQKTYRFIMVDEYQDTNELQYEILMPILEYLKSGNLFVVGDEKQSIYMFRDADLEIYDRTKTEITNPNTGGEVLTLPHSFRMYPRLILFTNKMFSRLFANARSEFNEVKHSDLVCTKENISEGSVSFLLADLNSDTKENELVAEKIIELVKSDSSIKFNDIGILCRKRDSFGELEETFVKYNIPFTIIGGKGFYQRQTIYDIYNYLAFLLNPKDDAALIGVLRSPFYNFSDSKIFLISEEEGDFFYEKVKIFVKKHPRDEYIIGQIEENRKLSYSHQLNNLIRKILIDSGYWTLLASKQNSSQELANVEKLLAQAREFSQKGFKNNYDFVTYLKEAINGTEDEGQAQVAHDENSIKLMTVHQSKGLEFKAVFIYGANEKGMEESIRARSVAVDKSLGVLAKVPLDEKYFEKYSTPPIVAYYNYMMKKKNRAELKRLFYVAVTRAIKHLFITASHKEFKTADGSLFQLLVDGLQNDLTSEDIYLADNVEFMKMKNDEYVFEKEKVELKISILLQGSKEIHPFDKKNIDVEEKEVCIQKISDTPKEEIISATKISMFAQCPVKYELTYEIGYSPILDLIKSKSNDYDFQPNEEESGKKYAQIRGKIVHKVLANAISLEQIPGFVEHELIKENNPAESIGKIKSQIQLELESYFQSTMFAEINCFTKYKNEFEIYCKDGDSFLYGIIDKMVYDGNKLIIIDYKTDSIEKEKITSRADSYFPQLKFYAYVLNNLYPEVNSYELRLVFLKHPDQKVSLTISKKELKEFGIVIGSAINKIYSQEYLPNLSHCAQCQYALEGNKCIKPVTQ